MTEQSEIPAPTSTGRHEVPGLLASVIITTYNRGPALLETLDALARQTVPPERYEIVVVDDGSLDGTFEALGRISLPCALRSFRHPSNRGISAGRNLALRHARGEYLVCVSDDLIVPEDFLERHLSAHQRFPGHWVVGAFRQIESLTSTPFGRYLDRLEREFEEGRKDAELGPRLWSMHWPSARNLSLPRADLERTGCFDENLRCAFEDQDLAVRARRHGIRFLYDAGITCLHNDQAGDLERHCRHQQFDARDGARFWAKHPDAHPESRIAEENGWLSRHDGPCLVARKTGKRILSHEASIRALLVAIGGAQRFGLPEPLLWKMYRALTGLHIFRGWREGLRLLESEQAAARDVHSRRALEELSGIRPRTAARE